MRDETVLSLDMWQMPYFGYGFRNGLCLIAYNDNKTRLFQYINLKGEVIYSWPMHPNTQDSNAPEMQETDRDAMLLRLFDGTEYYPLAEQCVRERKARANTNE
jgi:hypothetical protein